MSTELEIADMVEPLERMFEREFPVEPFISSASTEDTAQFVIVEPSSRRIHAVRIEASYSSCIFDLDAGIHVAQDLEANQRWIALPLDAFRDGEDGYNNVMLGQCKSRGVGIITVQQKGKGLSAKVILESRRNDGDFVESYPSIANALADADPVAVQGAGLRVVSLD